MEPRSRNKILKSVLLLSLVLFVECSPMATELRKVGFNEIQKGFDYLPKTPNLYKVVELKNVKIHIVGDRKHFKWDRAAAHGSPVVGYATTKNEIFLFGKVINGKIVINQAVLGHELTHLLNFQDPEIANPDNLDDLGA
ncbi:MAG: hypothetical protein JRJ04_14680 [Deltaproteobacteria bacterium]|nr:hypothetical protein [Deltaproteobacteria bacterium]